LLETIITYSLSTFFAIKIMSLLPFTNNNYTSSLSSSALVAHVISVIFVCSRKAEQQNRHQHTAQHGQQRFEVRMSGKMIAINFD